jgi:chemotaxis signal transduction protein
MSIFSTLRSRRFETRTIDNSQQMIAFRLAEEWFALPILEIYKVIPLGTIVGDPGGRGIGIVTYERREVLIVDVAKLIFPRSDISPFSSDEPQQRYLILLEEEGNNIIGLPIDSQPVMYRVNPSDFRALPEAYLVKGNIKCISSQMIALSDRPPIFLLNRQQLSQIL